MGLKEFLNKKKKLLALRIRTVNSGNANPSLMNSRTVSSGNANPSPMNTRSSSVQSRAPMNSRSSSVQSRARIEEELEQVFKKFDVNGDGKISSAELGSILSSLGQPATEEELEIMIKEVDSDGDGSINLKEFVELNTKDIDSDEIIENLKEAFSVYDIDQNGSISADELHKVLTSLGEECSLAECRKMITGVDADGNGTIDFEEFKVMMMMGSRFDAANEPQI